MMVAGITMYANATRPGQPCGPNDSARACQPMLGPSTIAESANIGTGGTTVIHSISVIGESDLASRFQVAERPAEAGEQGEDHRQQGGVLGAVPPDQHHADHGDRNADGLSAGDVFAQQNRAENDGEGCGRLQHERRQSGGHASRHRCEQEGELKKSESESVQQQPLQWDVRAWDEQHDGDCDDQEPQRGEEEGWKVIEPDADGEEVQPHSTATVNPSRRSQWSCRQS